MMDAPTFLPYDSRSNASAHMHRPVPAHYAVAPAYSSAQMPSMPAPHYSNHQAYTYMPYQSPPPSNPSEPLYKHDFQRPRAVEPNNDACRPSFRRDSARPLKDARHQSPSSRSESQVSSAANSTASNPAATSKTITYNETINPADRVNFDTDIDELMKVIQHKRDAGDSESGQSSTPAQSPQVNSTPRSHSPASSRQSSTAVETEVKPKKKWVCDGPSCNKRFVQKTHLDIHRRTHTGQKPYTCTEDDCGLTFSQRGNLKTHMRRHTGEKPYSCSICGKLFAQRGNVRSHEETHKGLKPFVCVLDDCNKTFSQLGNMKTHQNNFHKETLHRLTTMFVNFARVGEVPEEHHELFEYFKLHYKNSNKGIKGRGKDRTVAPKTKATAPAPASLSNPHLPMPTQQPGYVPAPGNSMAHVSRHGPRPAYEQQQPTHGNAAGVLYEDEQQRQMAFTVDRLY
ncbi:hypothetical protein CDD82_6673 [Ophiocordyceps australis]|uniref:C2H2-type domain-containing protein n=1 Tax=Ophiocordyceps australis TaxID=1399860 RepID=A0A2C5YW11_9HYPO|nr:hypothetical protein CDD82_6673 [Ophiocordyceps australis]